MVKLYTSVGSLRGDNHLVTRSQEEMKGTAGGLELAPKKQAKCPAETLTFPKGMTSASGRLERPEKETCLQNQYKAARKKEMTGGKKPSRKKAGRSQ